MRRNVRNRMQDDRGNAYAEAVVMLPVFVLVWASTMFVHEGYGNAIDASATARQHAWARALNHCEGARGGGVRVREIRGRGPLGSVAAVLRQMQTVLGWFPFMRRYLPSGDVAAGLELKEEQYTRTGRVRKPRPLGTGASRYGHTLALVCNEKPKDINLAELTTLAYAILVR